MREALERRFRKPFPKARPAWLLNPETGRRLELDAFCAELNLAVEFQGCQHRAWPNPFHRFRSQFDAQQRRDAWKAARCAERGIRLLAVPDSVPREMMEDYLAQQLPITTAVVVSAEAEEANKNRDEEEEDEEAKEEREREREESARRQKQALLANLEKYRYKGPPPKKATYR